MELRRSAAATLFVGGAILPVAAAAPRNNKQKTRRQLDGLNVDVGFGFVIIGLPSRLKYLG